MDLERVHELNRSIRVVAEHINQRKHIDEGGESRLSVEQIEEIDQIFISLFGEDESEQFGPVRQFKTKEGDSYSLHRDIKVDAALVISVNADYININTEGDLKYGEREYSVSIGNEQPEMEVHEYTDVWTHGMVLARIDPNKTYGSDHINEQLDTLRKLHKAIFG